MTSSRALRVLAALSTATALTLGGASASHGSVPTGTPAASGPSASVTLFLTAPNRSALAALAARPITDRAERMRQLSALLPGSGQRGSVEQRLGTLGLRVTHESTWAVTATGPRTVVTSLFGRRPALGAQPTAADVRAATGALPRLPGSLSGLVSGAYPTASGPRVFHPLATKTLKGSDFRNAYAAATTTPSAGAKDSGETVATLQLADFASSDLTAYAEKNGLPDPVAAGQYVPVKVAGGPTATDDAGEGYIEVALDQESILSTAPSAHQQAYFAPNTNDGFNGVFSAVLDDVTGNSMATHPNPHITAMSVSWGACETFYGKDAINVTEPIMESVVAAGVNIFSSSGDDGIYDCRSTTGTGLDNSQADVDFPTSSPAVVSVGGTNLSAATSAPNTGSNWAEKTWSCSSPQSCQDTTVSGTGGGGGGVSGSAFGKTTVGTNGPVVADFAGFAKPAYQSSAITTGPYAAPIKRMVPDIAADGDPSTGFVLCASTPVGGPCNDLTVGGTSLSAPISAAGFANALGEAGIAYGVGDLHPALYTAYGQTAGLAASDPTKVFRDITVGSNGATADKGADPSVSAAPGYDTTSGLGAVLWTALTPFLPKPVAHGGAVTATAKLRVHRVGRKHHKHRVVTATWTTAGPADSLVHATVTLTKGKKPKFTSTTLNGSKQLKARRGAVYTLTITGTDSFGETSTQTARLKIKRHHRHRHHHHHH